MTQWFSGEATVKVDDKGRLSLPPSIRRALDPVGPGGKQQLTLVYGNETQHHLEAYTAAAIAETRAKILELDGGLLKRQLRQRFFAQTDDLEVDANGRILLPKPRRDQLGLEGEVYIVGLGETFQMWRKDVHDAAMQRDLESEQGLGEGVDPMEALDAALAAQRRARAGT